MIPTFRVMSFNINGTFGNGDNSWEKRAPLSLAMIKRYRPDLIGVQECALANLSMFRDCLGEYGIVAGNCYGDNPPQEYTSILYLESRYELLDDGEFWFSETPDKPSADWDVEYPMGATWVRLKCKQTNQELFHANTHFEDGPWGERSRVNAARLMIDRAAHLAPGMPAVLTGDFNCNPWSKPYQVFLEAGFVDTYREAGHADSVTSSTFHAYQGREYFPLDYGDEMTWRVDWILAFSGDSPLRTTASTIIRDATPPTYPSDHYPVISELRFM